MNSYIDTPTPMYTDWHHLTLIQLPSGMLILGLSSLPGKSHSIPRSHIPSPSRKLESGGSPGKTSKKAPSFTPCKLFSPSDLRIHTIFTFYWDHLQLQKRKHCEDQITLWPTCTGFCSFGDSGKPGGKDRQSQGNPATEQTSSGQEAWTFPGGCVSQVHLSWLWQDSFPRRKNRCKNKNSLLYSVQPMLSIC